MAYGVVFEKAGHRVRAYFGGEWPALCELDISPNMMKKLGTRIVKFADGKKKTFLLCLDNKEERLTVYGEKAWFRGNTLISFEFDSIHPLFRVPCHNLFNYCDFSNEELVEFGKQLVNFDSNGCASIGNANRDCLALSFEEELKLYDEPTQANTY